MSSQTKRPISTKANGSEDPDDGVTIVEVLPYYATFLGTHLVVLQGLLEDEEVQPALATRMFAMLRHPFKGGPSYYTSFVGALPGKRIYVMVEVDRYGQ